MVSPIFRASVIVLALLAWSGTASATIIEFPDASSGEPPPIGELAADIEFSFDASTNLLTLVFDNQNTNGGVLTTLWFNTSALVADFADASVIVNTMPPNQTVDGFPGPYNWEMTLPNIANIGTGLGAGADATIVLLVTPALDEFGNPKVLSLSDFFVLVDDNAGEAALKFTQIDLAGGDDFSAKALGSIPDDSGGGGDPVPEPATLGLLLMGIVGIAATRLRRRTTS